MSTKNKIAMPKITTKISPLESVFEVEISEAGTNPWFGETFKFSLSSDGTVVINDNAFSSKKQASQALKAMSDFLAK